ncbi:HAD family hydrolase, partial [Staphylococcus epidermidis]|uniref:HAD family hydrolase n=1 Tax=Staphylococcus epidermidis TaxID=1282 RepID=UPI0021B47A5F
MVIRVDKELRGVVGVGDRVKDSGEEGIEKVDELGIEVGMLSGDKKGSAEGIGKQVGIERIIGEV